MTGITRRSLYGLILATLLAAIAPLAHCQEQPSGARRFPGGAIVVPNWRFASGPHVRNAFREVVAAAREATVRVTSDQREVALGGIVGADGWIITKASAAQGELVCRLADGREFPAKLVDASREHDLAVLKIDATDLPKLTLSSSAPPEVGSWLATVGLEREPIAVGVVSVEPREIPHQAGTLGVQLDETADVPVIVRVFPDTPAARAGVLVNDQILSVEGQPTPNREALVLAVRRFNPGDRVTFEVDRAGETVKLTAVLSSVLPGQAPSRSDFQNRLGGQLSVRRFGFPSAIQHDTVLGPEDCGGPVVNLAGEVVGFNVARSGRTESYAIASESVAKLIEELKVGGS